MRRNRIFTVDFTDFLKVVMFLSLHISRGTDVFTGSLINASSVLGDFGVSCKHFTQKLLRCGLVDFVATDAHNKDERAPLLSECFEYVEKKYGLKYAEAIFRDNALKILRRSSHNNGKE